MEPRIQYAKTSDGVNIAYATAGEGRPLINVSGPQISHVERDWEMWASVFQPSTRRFRMAWYDSRGAGLSEHDALDFSMEVMIRDLEAVVAATRFDSFVLTAYLAAVPIAAMYAAAHPERVSHLILCDGWTNFSDYAQSPAHQVERALREQDWLLYTETFGQVVWSHEDPVYGRQFAEYMRACCEPEVYRRWQEAIEKYDATDIFSLVTIPTLVIHNRGSRLFPLRVGQRIAAAISGARFEIIDDITYSPVPEIIERFVFEGEAPESTLPSGTAVILFADIADSTALTERLGDAAFRERARELDATLRAIIRENSGTPIEGKLLGDGVLATFMSARQTIEAALACGRAGNDAGLPLHLGLHAGDVIREENNVYGGAVNIAARISSLSAPGEVLVSDTVRSLARTSAGVQFEDRGEQSLKGVGEAVRVWAVTEGN